MRNPASGLRHERFVQSAYAVASIARALPGGESIAPGCPVTWLDATFSSASKTANKPAPAKPGAAQAGLVTGTGRRAGVEGVTHHGICDGHVHGA